MTKNLMKMRIKFPGIRVGGSAIRPNGSALSVRDDGFDTADHPFTEPYFYPVGMERRTGQDLPDDPTGLLSTPLVLFLDDIDG
jgi:hypothetical protein